MMARGGKTWHPTNLIINYYKKKITQNVFVGPKSVEKDLRVYEFCCIFSLFSTLHSRYAVENTHVFTFLQSSSHKNKSTPVFTLS